MKTDFRVEEATISRAHRAFRAKKLTATELVSRYLKRIRAYNGVCVSGAVDAATGLQLRAGRQRSKRQPVGSAKESRTAGRPRISRPAPSKKQRCSRSPPRLKASDAIAGHRPGFGELGDDR